MSTGRRVQECRAAQAHDDQVDKGLEKLWDIVLEFGDKRKCQESHAGNAEGVAPA